MSQWSNRMQTPNEPHPTAKGHTMTAPLDHARGNHPDTTYFNGPILTMDGPTPSYAEALTTSGGRIAFVGPLAQARERHPRAELRDLGGTALLPGFIDAHSHLSFAFELAGQANVGAPPVGPCSDIPAVLATLAEFRESHAVPEGGWIIGHGYDQETLAENRHITKEDLDAHFPHHLVMLVHVSSHGAVLNSAALAWAGVGASTDAPEGGIIARIPGTAEPAGLLMETAYIFLVADKMPRPDQEERLLRLDAAQQMYASNGYTHAQDGFATAADLDFYQTAAARRLLYLDVAALGSFLDAKHWLGNSRYPLGTYTRGFKIAGMKILQDGSPQGRTAYMRDPYLLGGPDGQQGWHGEPTSPFEQFAAVVKTGVDAGAQIFVHANGDAAIDDVVKAVDLTGTTAADDRRTVVIHSQFQRPDHLPDYVRLGITPSYFTNHAYFWGDVHITNVGYDKAAFISPLKSAALHGLVASNHTDFAVTPLDPFFVLWSSMARTTRSGVVLGPQERLTAYQALQAITTGPAHQMFEENRKGRLAPGLLADLVIVSADPTTVPVDAVRDLTVVETIKEGVTVFLAAERP